METNNNFDSKKIIEEIENLENDTSSKKKRKFGMVNFIETAILVVLIIYIVMTVGSQFIKDIFADYGYDYEYDDYYDEYDEYDDYYDYSTEEDYYTSQNNSSNIISNTLTIEEFMDSNYKNMITTENAWENISNSTNTNTDELEELPETVIKEEKIYNEEEISKQKFEDEKNNLKIVEEGKNISGNLLISIENKNSKLVHDFDVYTVFYKAEKIIKVDSQRVECILVNNKKFLKIDETPKDYDRFEVFIDKDTFFEFTDELLHDNLKYDSYIEDDELQIKLSNNGKKIDRANFTIIYLDKNKNILDIETTTEFDIGKYLGGNIRCYGVWDEINREYVEYDTYEIILDYAGNYNY